jgi:hypothetical protein
MTISRAIKAKYNEKYLNLAASSEAIIPMAIRVEIILMRGSRRCMGESISLY